MRRENVTGIILAGGKSTRMGSDKGLLSIHGKTFVEMILDKLSPLVSKVMISANNKTYGKFGVTVYHDEIKEAGPMGGLFTVLQKVSTDYILIISCDIPFVRTEILEYLLSKVAEGYDAFVPIHRGAAEPLCAVYSKNCLPVLRRQLEKKEFKMKEMFRELKLKYIPVDKIEGVEESLYNINTPESLLQINTVSQWPS